MKEGVSNLSLGLVQETISRQYAVARELKIADVAEQFTNKRQQLVTGVSDGVAKVRSEVTSLAKETAQPTVERYTTARDFTYQQVSITYIHWSALPES